MMKTTVLVFSTLMAATLAMVSGHEVQAAPHRLSKSSPVVQSSEGFLLSTEIDLGKKVYSGRVILPRQDEWSVINEDRDFKVLARVHLLEPDVAEVETSMVTLRPMTGGKPPGEVTNSMKILVGVGDEAEMSTSQLEGFGSVGPSDKTRMKVKVLKVRYAQ